MIPALFVAAVVFALLAGWLLGRRRAPVRNGIAVGRLGHLFENLPVPVFVIDAQHRVTHWNRACELVTGMAAAEVVGTRDPWKAFYPARRPVMADVVLNGFLAGQLDQYYGGKYRPSRFIPDCYEAEDFFPHMGSEGVWLAFTAAPLRDDAGRLVGAIETLVDITDKKRAERAMRSSEWRFRTLVEEAPDAIVVYDVESATLVDANPQAARLFGQSRERLIGIELQALVGATSPAEVSEDSPGLWEAAVRDALAGGAPGFEWRFPGTDGRLRVCDVRWVRLPVEDGKTFLRGSIADVTDRRAAEDALEAERTFLTSLLEAIPVAVYYKDRRGRYLGCNEAFLATLGRRREEVIGRTVFELMPAGPALDYAELDEALFRAPGRQVYEREIVRPDGVTRRLAFNKATFANAEGTVAGLIGVLLDVTELAAAQQRLEELNRELEARVAARTAELHVALAQLVQSEKLAALGHLVAGVAHELNTPVGNVLTVASAFADRLAELSTQLLGGRLKRSEVEAQFARLAETSRTLERNARRAAEMIGNFKQVAVDQASARRRDFDLAQTVAEILQTLHPLTRTRPEVVIETRIPAGIVLDSFPGPLEQVITNLVVNSLGHAFDGRAGGRITVAAEVDGEAVRIDYADDGCGMDAAVLGRIFDPFFTTKIGAGGSGLGLYLVQTIVGGPLGGRLAVDSAPGRGTRFTIRLPRRAPAAAATG